jgi:Calpain family cysteine protease
MYNIPYSHAYSIIAVFNIKASNGTQIPVFMIRNPWGTCGNSCYNGLLNSLDPFWTTYTIN